MLMFVVLRAYFVCVRMCVRACMRAYVRTCLCAQILRFLISNVSWFLLWIDVVPDHANDIPKVVTVVVKGA